MAHGIIHSPRHGPRHGIRHGSLLFSDSVPSDGPGGYFVPASASDFTALGIVPPQHLWGCQEASGNLLDLIGSVNLAPSVTPLYQQTVAGWTRKAVGTTDATNGQRFSVAAGTGPNPASVSVAWILYFDDAALPAAERNFLLAGANCTLSFLPTTGRIRARIAGAAVADSAQGYCDGAQHAVILIYDRTGSLTRVHTDLETISPVYNAGATDGTKGIGSAGLAPTCRYLWLAAASGATAEGYSAATLTALGVP